MKFSLCMIVKNEEAVLNRCLESMASAMDEIIIVDTGSTDATKRSPQRIPIRSMILRGQETLQRQGTMQLPRQPVITFIRQMPMNIWSRKSCRSYCSSKGIAA